MTPVEDGSVAAAPERGAREQQVPTTRVTLVLGGVSVVVVALTAWLAVQPAANSRQTGIMLWFNHPPRFVGVVLAAVNPLLRPVPLLLLTVCLLGWVLLTASGTVQRLEVLRAALIAIVVAELVAQALKRVADQARPLAVIPGLDLHGYPSDPHGNAYPSAHTAVAVAAVSALWPWMRGPQRAVGVTTAVLVACNRLYIGAHWPVDVVGGAAIGLLAGTISWLAASRWPLRDGSSA